MDSLFTWSPGLPIYLDYPFLERVGFCGKGELGALFLSGARKAVAPEDVWRVNSRTFHPPSSLVEEERGGEGKGGG